MVKEMLCTKCGYKRWPMLIWIVGFLLLFILFFPLIPSFANSQNIEQPSKSQQNLIQTALGDQYQIKRMACILSSHHKKAYYVGAIFYAHGVGNITGVWIVGGPKNDPNLVFSVDGAAHQFSGMRKASETRFKAYISDPEVDLLKKHLKKQ